MASEEPDEFLGGFGRVREHSVFSPEEEGKAPASFGSVREHSVSSSEGTEEALGGFGGTRRLSRWLRMRHKTVLVASEQPKVALGG